MKSLEERKKVREATRREREKSMRSTPKREPAAQRPYTSMNKADLIELVKERGYEVESTDTVATLIQTLKDDDAEKAKAASGNQE